MNKYIQFLILYFSVQSTFVISQSLTISSFNELQSDLDVSKFLVLQKQRIVERGFITVNPTDSYYFYDEGLLKDLVNDGDFKAVVYLLNKSNISSDYLDNIVVNSLALGYTKSIDIVIMKLTPYLINEIRNNSLIKSVIFYEKIMSLYELGVLFGDMTFLKNGILFNDNLIKSHPHFVQKLSMKNFSTISNQAKFYLQQVKEININKGYPALNYDLYPSDVFILNEIIQTNDNLIWGELFLKVRYKIKSTDLQFQQ